MNDFASMLYPDTANEPVGNTVLSTGAIPPTPTPLANDKSSTDAASTLYGGQPQYQPEEVQEVNEHPLERNARQEKSLYGDEQTIKLDIPEDIKELRKSPERLLAGDNLGNSITQEFFDQAIDDPKLAKAVAQESRAILTDLGFSQGDVSELGMAINDINRVGEINSSTREQLRNDAIETLNREHGDRANQVYRDIVKLVNRDARFANFLNQSNLGESPRMASILGRLAVKARNSGQIK